MSIKNSSKIKKKWVLFLQSKGFTPEIYNLNTIKERNKKNKKTSFLKSAKNKKELELLLKAREIVDTSIERVNESNSNIKLEEDTYEFYVLEVYENLKPEIDKEVVVEKEVLHIGDYYSKDVYQMITQFPPWYILCHEYHHMNILDNADEESYIDNSLKVLNGYRLKDIVK
jgi:ribosomal protein S8